MKRPWAIVVIFIAGLALGGSVVWAVAGNDDSGSGDTNLATNNSSTNSGTANSNELVARLADGEKATFHVRYAAGSESGPHAILEVWHTADRVRRDVSVVGSTESTKTEEFLNNGQYVRCVLLDGRPWQCVAAPAAEANLKDPLGGAAGNVKGKDVTVSDDTIAGAKVKCYAVPAASSSAKPSRFCLSDDNVPLSIDGGDGKATTATNYDTNVPDSVFTYPATVAGLSSSTTAST
jgi:hypothetical protein